MAEPPGCQVWLADVSQLNGEHEKLLDATERGRAAAFVRPEDRSRFVLGAVLLKFAVADATSGSPQDVVVDRSCDQCGQPHGRPRVPAGGIDVSVAHSGSLVAVALSRLGPVGIDVEQQAGEADPALVKRVIAAEELAETAGLPMREFLTYWCRKESVLKATGEGLRVPMTEVLVTGPHDPPSLRSYRGGRLDAVILDLDVGGPSYVAALTVITGGPVDAHVARADRMLGA